MYSERFSTYGVLQQIDPRVKLFSIAALVLSAVAVRTITPLLILIVTALGFCAASRIPLKFFFLRTTIFIPIFAGVISLPLPFITPGVTLASLEYGKLVVVITREGLYRATQFTLRVWVCVALSVLLILTTKFSKFIEAMRNLRFPRILVTMMTVTYRFIFLFINETYRMVLARESRTIRKLRWRENVKSLANMIATLFIRAHERGEKVYLAMMARGYTGTLRSLDNMKCTKRDWVFANISILICLAMLSVEYLHLGG
jgi:cobalt/nickel transport system permease protein